MEMTPGPAGAALAHRLTAQILASALPPALPGGIEGSVLASATSWLGSVSGAAMLAAGTDPGAVEPAGPERGAELAAQFMDGTLERVCCDWCHRQLVLAMAWRAAALFTRLHGDRAHWQWEQLGAAHAVLAAIP